MFIIEIFSEYIYAWLSFSLKNGKEISDGTKLEECARVFGDSEQIAAIGINCAPTVFVTEAINVLSANKKTDYCVSELW